MASTVPVRPPAAVDIEPIRVPVWAWLVVAFAALTIYLATLDNSLLGDIATKSHEFFHDARHFIGVPCH